MARNGGQSAVMSVLTVGIGVFIVHAGIDLLKNDSSKLVHLGQSVSTENYNLGAIIIGLGIALLAAGAKLFAIAIEDSFFPPRMTPEEVWEDTPILLQSRLHYAVTKGYLRVVVKRGELHEMMNMPKQHHLRLIGKEGGIVEISRAMGKHISEAPDDEIRAFLKPPAVINPSLTESFWTPQPMTPVPAQNY